MKIKIVKVGEELVLVLPDEFVARLDWEPGDLLQGEVANDALKIVPSKTKHERALEIAREGMEKYRDTLEALAKT